MKTLTARQYEVLLLIAYGLSDAEIAERLKLSTGTIQRYVEAIRDRLRARNRAHAVTIALQEELVQFKDGKLCPTSPN